MSIATRTRLFFVALVFAFIAIPAAAQDCSATEGMEPDPDDAGLAWKRWERRIPSERDYLANHGNPSRDVQFDVTFTRCDVARNAQSFTTSGFWYGLPEGSGTLAGQDFRIRGAFPPGTWEWVVSCTSAACAGDSVLNGARGRFEINEVFAFSASADALPSGGFLKVFYPKKRSLPILPSTTTTRSSGWETRSGTRTF